MSINRDDINKMSNEELAVTIMAKISTMPRFSSISGFTDAAKELAEWLSEESCNKSEPKEINIHLGYPKMIFTENCDCITFTYNSINNFFGKEKYNYYTIFDDNHERLFKQWKNIVNINKIPLNAKYIQFINDIGDKSSMYPIEILKNIEEVTNLPNKIKKVELTEQEYKDILTRLDKLESNVLNEEKIKECKTTIIKTADQMFKDLGYSCKFKTDKGFGYKLEEVDHYLYTYENDSIGMKYIKIYTNGKFTCNEVITPSEHNAIIKKLYEIRNG